MHSNGNVPARGVTSSLFLALLYFEISSAIRRFSRAAKRPFHFNHMDMGIQNILVDDDFNFVAVIDWELAQTAPWEVNHYPPTRKLQRFSTTQDTRAIAIRHGKLGRDCCTDRSLRRRNERLKREAIHCTAQLRKFSMERRPGSTAWLERLASFMVWRKSSQMS